MFSFCISDDEQLPLLVCLCATLSSAVTCVFVVSVFLSSSLPKIYTCRLTVSLGALYLASGPSHCYVPVIVHMCLYPSKMCLCLFLYLLFSCGVPVPEVWLSWGTLRPFVYIPVVCCRLLSPAVPLGFLAFRAPLHCKTCRTATSSTASVLFRLMQISYITLMKKFFQRQWNLFQIWIFLNCPHLVPLNWRPHPMPAELLLPLGR